MKRLFFGSLLSLVLLSGNASWAQGTNSTSAEQKDVAYARTLNERATKIAATLQLADAAKSNRVHGLLVQQYRSLNDIHFVRDVAIGEAKAKFADDKAAANKAIEAVRAEAKPKLDQLHGEFVAKLSRELSAEQVEQVKDGLTYGVLPLTYGVYLKMYPDLTGAQKTQIKAWLTEARELAMDGSTSDEKHAAFGKYKGRINNYLSKAGYDAKKAEQNLKKASQTPSETKSK